MHTGEQGKVVAHAPTLELIGESKICDLIRCDEPSKRWEASGVLARDGYFFVVFDDRTEVARIASDLKPSDSNGLLGMAHTVRGYEGITYSADKQRYYLLVEARKHAKRIYKALIVEYDAEFNYLKERPIDFEFESENKGFEAVAHVRRNDEDYLLALCEGNFCQCGRKGRTPGGGRVQLFEKKRKCWSHSGEVELPEHLPFVDYSGMSLDSGRVAIVSQENSMLWVGQFDESSWTWRDEGRLYEFPRSDDGEIRYGNIEGVAWIGPTRVVTVSDRRKKQRQPDERLCEKDQSVQLFNIPRWPGISFA